MAKEEGVVVLGKVLEQHKNEQFDVELENGHIVRASIAGKLRTKFIRILPDDWVDVEISPYDLNRGRIRFRHGAKPRK